MAKKISNKKFIEPEVDITEKIEEQLPVKKKPKAPVKKVVVDTPEPKKKRKYTKKKPVVESAESIKEKKELFIKEKLEKRDRVLKEASKHVVHETPKELTLMDIYNQFILDDEPFKVYHKGIILFDSKLHIEMPILTEEYIIVFGKNYIYRGIQFTKY